MHVYLYLLRLVVSTLILVFRRHVKYGFPEPELREKIFILTSRKEQLIELLFLYVILTVHCWGYLFAFSLT